MHSRRIVQIALLAGFAAGLAGCSSIKDAAGGGKDSPDEFAVVTKAPLVIPPDFNLRPPAPGQGPTNSVEPTQAAQNALFNADPSTVAAAMPATMSSGERYLLAYAHVQDADPAIRQQIASDVDGMRGADDTFTNNILFGSPSNSGDAPVDADAEANRIAGARAGGNPVTTNAPPAAPPSDSDSSSDDGWLGHLWPF